MQKFVAAITMFILVNVVCANVSLAQGQPVKSGSHWPVALIFAGVVALGIVLAYGILRNKNRSSTEKRVSEQVTAERYRTNSTTKD
jgi:predicted Na+-dependent transporter